MGIIIKQSVRGAFWSYMGIAVGYINIGIIMPQFFDTAQIGLVQIFIAVSLIFSQFATLGFTSVINRMFPVFRNPQKQHNGFLFLAMVTGIAGFALSLAGFFILKPWIIESNIEKSPLLIDYLFLLMPLVFMRLLFTLLDNYNKVLYDAVTGTFWLEFMHKVINLLLIIAFVFGLINFRQFFFGYIISMSMPVIPVIYVLSRRNEFQLKPDWEFLTRPVKKEVGTVMTFGFVNGLAAILMMNVDKIFVNQYLSLNEVGIFGVCALFATLIKVPYNSIAKISTGIIAESWKRNDIVHIQEIYRKSAINQAIAGTLIFVGILVNLHNIFEILPPVYSSGKWVLVVYSAGMLWVTIIGMAGIITETSRYFRVTTLFLLLSVLLQFFLNYMLIPKFGITGAAVATITAFIVNYSFQLVFQWVKFGIKGLSKEVFIVMFSGLVIILLSGILPRLSLLPDIALRSGIVTFVFCSVIYFLKVSPEINDLVNSYLNKLGLNGRK
jgi:O-antigen/teichoic acid export membrane protein